MYLQLISLTLVATVLAHGPGGFGGPGGLHKEPQSCVDEHNAHKECITSNLKFTFEPAAVHACFETCTPTANVASAPARAQLNKRSRRGARGGQHQQQQQRFPMGPQNGANFTAMMEQMKATHECMEAAMATPMETCLKENGVTFTLVAPPEPPKINVTKVGPPPMGGPGGFKGGKPGHHNPAQELQMMEQRATECGEAAAACVKTAMNGNTAAELSALLCTADTACPKPAADSQCKQDRDVLRKAMCICKQSLAEQFEQAAATCAASSGVTTPFVAKQRGDMKQHNCSAEHPKPQSAESAESAEEKQSPFCQTANAVQARAPARDEQQGNNTAGFQMMFNGQRPQFGQGNGQQGGQARPQFGQGGGQGGQPRPQFGQGNGQRPSGGNGGRPQPVDETATTTEAPLVKRRAF